MLGNFLSCIHGIKDHFKAQEGLWDFSPDATVEKGLISHLGENLLVSLELRQQSWGPSRVTKGTSGTQSWGPQERPVSILVARDLSVVFCN